MNGPIPVAQIVIFPSGMSLTILANILVQCKKSIVKQ